MAIVFPRTDLFTSQGFAQHSFALVQRQELSRAAGGIVIGKDLGPALWAAEWTTAPQMFKDAVAYEAMLRSLDGVIGTFEAYDLRRPYPSLHADGDFTDEGQIHSINANNKAMRLKNLAAGFTLSVGDYIAFDYGSPASRALHQVMESAVANGSGVTPEFEVRPHIRPGAAADDEVTLKKPSAVFTLVPAGMSSQMQGGLFSSSSSFQALQYIG